MHRRKLLLGGATIATGLLAGCTDQGNNSSDGEDTPTRVIGYSLSEVDDAPQNHTVQSYENNMITIAGTIQVPNACHTVYATQRPTSPMDSQRIEVTVGSEDTSADDVACTQAVESRGYELQIEVQGDPTGIDLTLAEASGTETVSLSIGGLL